jgi:hypothetical protein
MQSGKLRLAHGWTLDRDPVTSRVLVCAFLRPAVKAVPSTMARRLGFCRCTLLAEAKPGVASRWTTTDSGLEVSLATAGVEAHDVAMELLLCLGQALWERLSEAELRAYWLLLREEISKGVEGEIDEQALEEKRSLFASRANAASAGRLMRYGRASFAGTAAEYVHSLWHDVTVRAGPDYLPAPELRRRLELLAGWFPPDRGYRLFPSSHSACPGSFPASPQLQ